MQARARGALIKLHQLFAFFEPPEGGRQRADIHRLRGDIEQVIEEPADLAEKRAYELRPRWNGNSEEFLLGQRKGMLLIHRTDIVQTIEIRHRLHIGFLLHQLFGAAVEQSDMRINSLHDLSVELQHKAQNAMGGRMLRPEIYAEGTIAGSGGRIAHRGGVSLPLSSCHGRM